ncbi:MAG TPA: YlxR family protein [Clostridia bacterium]|nr:MAG: hypothetical protein BWY35_01615 [Firmicutes bacterium ADurb.Bin248]HOG01735.1 YlxR family protein [Clostridia bacterium]HOS17837.1 YlxR family protein [Clostridia bacterium]HPK16564.1 YlxR family protein [Clostridia bacterium]
MAEKKVPMRMCVACRQMTPKKQLIRVVRTPQDEIRPDPTGKASGRGAYLCRNPQCLERAKKTKALERALEHKVGDEVFALLEKEIGVG